MELTCYVYPGWRPRIRAATSRRAWMDASPESFAYRCLPLNIANAHGWEILSPCGFEASWNGGSAVEDVSVRPDPGIPPDEVPVALFGQGTFTIHIQGLFRTAPGMDLWVGGPPNGAKDGVAPLNGVIEADWAPYTFTMNWRFTRPHHAVRFEENEPICFLFPIERALAGRCKPRIAPIEEEPDLKRRFEEWSTARDRFQEEVAANPSVAPGKRWQKFYYRGTDVDGTPGPVDHRTKLHLPEFEGSKAFHAPARPAAACPVAHRGQETKTASPRLAWMMTSLESLRTLSANRNCIHRKANLSADEFLENHYAVNWPVILEGELRDWPALSKWSPNYLAETVGSAEVEVQSGRGADPHYERRMAAHSAKMPFDAFIRRVRAAGDGNDCYLTAYNAASNRAAVKPLEADLGFLDHLLDRHAEGSRGMLWIGGAGTFTPLHHDLTNNLLLQIAGRKRVLLAAPGEAPRLYNSSHVYSDIRDLTQPDLLQRYPLAEGTRVHEVVIAPGDALFIPLGWWHQVEALDFSVSITHTNFRWPNEAYRDFPA